MSVLTRSTDWSAADESARRWVDDLEETVHFEPYLVRLAWRDKRGVGRTSSEAPRGVRVHERTKRSQRAAS